MPKQRAGDRGNRFDHPRNLPELTAYAAEHGWTLADDPPILPESEWMGGRNGLPGWRLTMVKGGQAIGYLVVRHPEPLRRRPEVVAGHARVGCRTPGGSARGRAVTDEPTRHFTVEETDRGWIVWVKITTSTKRYQGPASLYPFPSAEAAWLWIREQFGPDLTGGRLRDDPAGEDLAE